MKKKINRYNEIINLGLQPVSNRYNKSPNKECLKTDLILEQSSETGIIKLKNSRNPIIYKPLVKWIKYNEPEPHLDQFVNTILKKYFNNKKIIVGGISSKDDSTLNRFLKLGHKIWRIDEKKDLKISYGSGIETIQHYLAKNRLIHLNKKYDKVDFLVVRHIWEHVYNQKEFSDVLKGLIKKDGIIFIEIPDCRKLLKSKDITMIWEEHLFYYTSQTIITSLRQNGLRVISKKIISYPTENSILLCVKPYKKKRSLISNLHNLKKEISLGVNYGKQYQKNKKYLNKLFSVITKKKKEIVLFGGGHLSLAFIAFYDIYKYISFIVDDDVNKKGMFMPGSSIQIKSSNELTNKQNILLLLTVNLTSEKKLIKLIKKKYGNIKIKSIFPLSTYSIFKK
ncbi:hypothetical protein PB7211_705 [Candidatus Pelagibacter sp. HTCC7211]|uniref:methyltransferase domain-containing protein n=1 Tax=Pelagibacter sp. (strain HTCC7211) TaxID=439493 RepID=UPI000183A8E0|nr:methyltransferase domain-containing protein [Candidatus Pelagibacter sp. HTCC7211]EDZ60382.1 hypothetical protein PB7211_705 [Candidatus Pelagibacter sp. HTCC7211]MBD1151175.1 hypothetical protein [Pelagibacterales bacterium SAG-MED25]